MKGWVIASVAVLTLVGCTPTPPPPPLPPPAPADTYRMNEGPPIQSQAPIEPPPVHRYHHGRYHYYTHGHRPVHKTSLRRHVTSHSSGSVSVPPPPPPPKPQ